MQRGRTKRQQRHPLALILGDVAQLFADKLCAVQIMTLDEESVETFALVGFNETELHTLKQGLLFRRENWSMFSLHRPPQVKKVQANVQLQ